MKATIDITTKLGQSLKGFPVTRDLLVTSLVNILGSIHDTGKEFKMSNPTLSPGNVVTIRIEE